MQGSVSESLSTQLFKNRLQLLEHLQNNSFQVKDNTLTYNDKPVHEAGETGTLEKEIITLLHNEVSAMNVDNFIVRM